MRTITGNAAPVRKFAGNKIRATLTDCDPACEMPGNPGNGNTHAGGRDAAMVTEAWPRAEKSAEETMPKASARACSGKRNEYPAARAAPLIPGCEFGKIKIWI